MQERDPLPQLKKYVLDTGILTEQQVRTFTAVDAVVEGMLTVQLLGIVAFHPDMNYSMLSRWVKKYG